jgi:antitoxin component YwqK of YwqJK toxin-antitoxin module
MSTEPRRPAPYTEYHKDGSVWARGQKMDDVPVGYWEWFRRDGTKLRSGTFDNGEQSGEWTTYDKQGNVFKVSRIKPRPP